MKIYGPELWGSTKGKSSLLEGLDFYFKMEEASGTRICSVAPGINDLAATGSVLSGTAKIGLGASCTTTPTFLSHATSTAFQSGGDVDFCFSMWYRASGSQANARRNLIWKGDEASNNTTEYGLYNDTGDVPTFVVGNNTISASVVSAVLLTTITPYHFVYCEHNSVANTIGISIDNETLITAAYSGGSFNSGNIFRVSGGSAGGANPANGSWDELSKWHRILTTTERNAIYNGGAGLTYTF